jgi:hypothetical protein
MSDNPEHERVEAFNRMTCAMDRLGSILATVDERQQGRRFREDQEASTVLLAASEAKAAAQAAHHLAAARARSLAAWVAGGVLAGVLVAGGAGYWIGHVSGRESGLAEGYQAARNEQAAATWANTPSGKLAFAMDRAGSLSMVEDCTNHGWKVEIRNGQRMCLVQPASDGSTYGWVLPSPAS